MAIYVKNTIPVQQANVKVPEGLECMWLHVTPHFLPQDISELLLGAVYNPPRAATERELVDHIAHTISCIKAKHPHCAVAICGDFNRADIRPILSKGLKQVVRAPTRGEGVLDLIITNISSWYRSAELLPPIGKSDHSSVLWQPCNQQHPPNN